MTNRPTSRDAFTLIELLVVITIIAVIAALLLPAISQVRAQANTMTCANNMKGLAMAFEGIASDDEGRLPWGNFGPSPYPGNWMAAVEGLRAGFKQTCPSAAIRKGNRHFTANMQVLTRRSFGFGPWSQVHTSELRSDLVVLFDSGQQTNGSAFPSSETMGLTFYFRDNPALSGSQKNDVQLPVTSNGNFRVFNRHGRGKRANYLFGDGHVKCMAPTEFINENFRIDSRGRKYY